jgi:glutamate-1-semialdehyde aminotransferase
MDIAFRRGLMARGVFSIPVPLKRNHLTTSHSEGQIGRTLEAAEDVLGLIAARKPTT